ncbi:MAG TPA: hypothetical protein VMW28_03165 [Pelolinea sp.]|nr:hypothetical protein [Pelolinea sp.]
MTELSPADARLIRAFCDGVRKFASFDASAMYQVLNPLMKPMDCRDLGRKMLPLVKVQSSM